MTSVFGFNSNNSLEVDLGMFYRKRHHGDSYNIAFVECKTLKPFQKKDIDRMKDIAQKFPNSQIVFATLNQELSKDEKDLLIPFVNWSRKIDDITYKPRNEVIILTETELLAEHNINEAWKLKGGQHKELSEERKYDLENNLWDITQQVYLDLSPWEEWLEEKMKR